MTEILTQEEIDALIANMAGSDSEPSPGGEPQSDAPPPSASPEAILQRAESPLVPENEDPAADAMLQSGQIDIHKLIQSAQSEIELKSMAKKDYKLYDFRRPEKFTKEQARAIRNQMEVLSRLLNNYIAKLLRFNTEVTLLEISQCNYGDVKRTTHLNSIIGIFNLEENKPGHGVFQFSLDMAFTMIERLMGGDGSPNQHLRDLTEFEKLIISDYFQRFMEFYSRSMRDFADMSCRITQVETDERLIPKAFSPTEVFVKSTFEIQFPKNRGFMVVSIPYHIIASYFNKGKFEEKRGGNGHSITLEKIPQNVKDLGFKAEVNLGKASLSIRELLDLKPGSVIVLDRRVDEQMEVYVNNRPKFKVRPGYVNNKMGVQIASIYREGMDQDD
jgi:flagellar motor switch protein FliM